MTQIGSTSPKYLLVLAVGFVLLGSLAWYADEKDEPDINKRLDASAAIAAATASKRLKELKR